jgi:hypothetical protein
VKDWYKKSGATVVYQTPDGTLKAQVCKDDGVAWELYDQFQKAGCNPVIFLNENGLHERRK